jgi:peptidyl-prolyl cis-trans isomerase C
VATLSAQRMAGAARFLRSRFRSDARWQGLSPGHALPALERDRLFTISQLAERAGITGPLATLLRDPRVVDLVAGHFRVPPPSTEACRRYYRDHQDEFREPDRYLGRQIVLPLDADIAERPDVWARAERIVAILNFTPHMFPDLLISYGSQEESSGQLGPVARGALPAPLDAIFFALRPGEICPVPIVTEQGVHVVMLDRILSGEAAPFMSVHSRISFLLRQDMRRAAAARHLARLADRHACRAAE